MAYFSTSLSSTLSYTFQNILPGDLVDIIVSYAPVNQQNGHIVFINNLLFTPNFVDKKNERMHSLYNAIIKEGLLGKLLRNDLITRMDENICNAVMKCLKTGYSSLTRKQRKMLGNLPPACKVEISEGEYLEVYKRIQLIHTMYWYIDDKYPLAMKVKQVCVCTRAVFIKRFHLQDFPEKKKRRFLTVENMAVIKEVKDGNRFILCHRLYGFKNRLCQSFTFQGVQYSSDDEISDNQSSCSSCRCS